MRSTWRIMIFGVVLGGIILTGAEGLVHADKQREALEGSQVNTWAQRRLAVMLHGSLGGPFGWAGASIDYNPFSWLSIEAGGGKGFSGWQWAVEPRLRLPIGTSRWGISIGGGLSGGAYEWERDRWDLFYVNEGDVTKRWNHALWTNFTISGDFRAKNGFQMRLYHGYGFLVNTQDYSCQVNAGQFRNPGSCAEPAQELVPYFGVSMGWSF